MSLKFELRTEIPAKAETIYNAWLDSKEHALMTEAEFAIGSHEIGAMHQAFGNYITGKNLELVPFSKIVQSWRNVDFQDSDPDSILEIYLKEKDGITILTLIHSGVPEQEFAVEQGWEDYYFAPMKNYFKAVK